MVSFMVLVWVVLNWFGFGAFVEDVADVCVELAY